MPLHLTAVFLIVAAGLNLGAPAPAAIEPASGCNVAPTNGPEPRHPYLGTDAATVIDTLSGSAYRYGNYPYVYTLYVPQGLPDGPVPLLVGLHGTGHSAASYEDRGLQELADAHAFIVAFASGPRAWWFSDDAFDTQFLRDVVTDVRAERCIDPLRIWATGSSNGSSMGQRLACDAGDLFAAVAVYAGVDADTPPWGGPCTPGGTDGYEPVPIGFWHGEADSVVPYSSGRRALEKWLARYRCDTAPVAADDAHRFGPLELYGNCHGPDIIARESSSGVAFRLQFRTFSAHPHDYPDGCGGTDCDDPGVRYPRAADMNAEIYEFLSAYARIAPASETPKLGGLRLRDPLAAATWAAGGTSYGGQPESALHLVDASGDTIDAREALRGSGPTRTIRVELAVYARPGVTPLETMNPSCPPATPDRSKLRYPGREVALWVTDLHGSRQYTATTAEQPATGLAVATFHIARPHPRGAVIEALTHGDAISFSAACTIREARFQETVGRPHLPVR